MTGSRFSWRFIRVWQRNFIVYQKIWKVNFIPPLLEPILYIVAFGMGLGGLVGDVAYEGMQLSYIRYIAPALIATAIMWNSFFETTYGSFVRMYYQKTFDGMLATPLSLEEIIVAEICWGATKSFIASAIMLMVVSAFGLLAFPQSLALLPLAFLGGLAFGAAGMICTGITPSIDMFNLPLFLFITPMFLFSGTFFPLTGMPDWAAAVAYGLPLYHLVELCRQFAYARVDAVRLVLHLAYLAAMLAVCLPLALWAMRRRLIK